MKVSRFSHRSCARILLLGTTLLFLAAPISFARTIEVDADRQFEFAGHLFSRGDYDRAVTEYERFIFLFPEDARGAEARYQIGMAHVHTKNEKQAIEAFSQVIDRHGGRPVSGSDITADAYFRISECYVRMGETGQAVNNLNNLAAVAESDQIQGEARYRMGWILLEAGHWEKAALVFRQIPPDQKGPYRLPDLFNAMEGYGDIPQKNPAAAGILAVIPGMGYIYCGRYQDALVSFLLNGAMMVAAYKAFENDNPALGGLLTVVELGFYSGSIYGSISSAHKYNRDQAERFTSEIRRRHKIDLSLSPVPGGAALSFRYPF
ncbi:tol-pal system YbgF family protein [Desulfococcus sp.]|uniref:tetratricopeptide repeat protein n=1 Tax=Desulfococcus sp. TaxID=2025834 RepID=UPI003593E556